MGRRITRRQVLVGGVGLGAAGLATGTAMITDVLPGGPALRRAVGMTGPDGTVPDAPAGKVTTQRERSAARDREVDVVTMRPHGIDDDLPVCLVLHGRGATAKGFIDFGLPQVLTASSQRMTLVAVDCGDGYFVARDGDDPLRMLTDELPGWLGRAPTGVLGISMGCFGALCLARRADFRAVALASPALFLDWPDASSRNAFRDEREWLEYEPLRHVPEIAGTPLGVWCGTEDPFVDAAHDLVAKANPQLASITRGAHTDGYWLRVLPELLRFVGSRL